MPLIYIPKEMMQFIEQHKTEKETPAQYLVRRLELPIVARSRDGRLPPVVPHLEPGETVLLPFDDHPTSNVITRDVKRMRAEGQRVSILKSPDGWLVVRIT